jgi:hypothetical protein
VDRALPSMGALVPMIDAPWKTQATVESDRTWQRSHGQRSHGRDRMAEIGDSIRMDSFNSQLQQYYAVPGEGATRGRD